MHEHMDSRDFADFIIKHPSYIRQPELMVMALAAVASDSVHVSGPSLKTPEELLKAYGILGDNEYARDRQQEFKLNPQKDSGELMIWLVLDGAKSWGEFLGGVIASWPLWTDAQRSVVYPALMRACKYAVEVGVDS